MKNENGCQSRVYASLPEDISETLALSVLDVAGAPAQTKKLVRKDDIVVVIGGGGKSGLLCLYEAKQMAGKNGKVICVDEFAGAVERAKKLQVADEYLVMDATEAMGLYNEVSQLTNGELADVVINVVNVENTEMSSIMACKEGGTVYFFSTASSFTKAASGAEGAGKDVNMLMDNGYAKEHLQVVLQALEEYKPLKEYFDKTYTGQ